MSRIKRVLLGLLLVLLLAAGIAFAVPALRVKVLGFLGGESFFDGRPYSAWRDDLKGEDSSAALDQLKRGGVDAIPMLLELARAGDDDLYAKSTALLVELGDKAAPALAKSLGQPDDKVTSLHVLGKIGRKAKGAAYPLVRFFNDSKDKAEKLAVLSILASMGPAAHEAMPDLTRVLKDGDTELKRSAVLVLGAIGPEAKSAIPLLIASLDESALRPAAGGALAKIGPESAAPLIEVVRTVAKPAEVRAEAVRTLAHLGQDAAAATPELIACLKETRADLNLEACRALAAIGPAARKAVPDLIPLLPAKDKVSAAAMDALANIGPDAKPAVPALVSVYGEKAPIQAIGPVAIPNLVEMLAMPKESAAAAHFLKQFKGLALEPLLEALQHDDAAIRAPAATLLRPKDFALSANDLRKVLPQLRELLKDMDKQVVAAARETLRSHGKNARPEFDALLSAKEDEMRIEGARLLATLGPEARPSARLLLTALREENPVPAVQLEAVHALAAAGMHPKEAVPVLLDALKKNGQALDCITHLGMHGAEAKAATPLLCESAAGNDPALRAAAVSALGRIGLTKELSLPIALKCLKDPSPEVRLAAARAIAMQRPAQSLAAANLTACLKDDSEAVRLAAVVGLGMIGPDSKPALGDLLRMAKETQSMELRGACIVALGQMGPNARAAASWLQSLLEMGDEPHGVQIIDALGRMQAVETAPALGKLLNKDRLGVAAALALWRMERAPKALTFLQEGLKQPELCEGCLRALAHIGKPAQAAEPALLSILESDPKHRVLAAEALGKTYTNARAIVPKLVAALRIQDVQVRIACAAALAKFDEAAAPAVPSLLQFLDDPESPALRQAAAAALLLIDPEAAAAAGIL
ncbi:MAG: HEAT repeat domain-containing protein [Gemmataceae bacterium]|nr:HEAT repeat domain-containing protein [Gemmataceae bacterium]MCI0741187.1 HEAT repeat domain-containing protein [Gemmataceae bacterium]